MYVFEEHLLFFLHSRVIFGFRPPLSSEEDAMEEEVMGSVQNKPNVNLPKEGSSFSHWLPEERVSCSCLLQ